MNHTIHMVHKTINMVHNMIHMVHNTINMTLNTINNMINNPNMIHNKMIYNRFYSNNHNKLDPIIKIMNYHHILQYNHNNNL